MAVEFLNLEKNNFIAGFLFFSYLCTMQKEFLHLTYLLTKHECVTLPGFGAFVVQPVSHSDVRIPGSFPAFAFSLSFNSELSHNDGLLVSSIQKEQQISYNEANLRVNRFVEELSQKLHFQQQQIFIPGVGKLYTLEGRIIFSPDDFLSCNASNYGLSDFFMPSLSDLMKVERQVGEVQRPIAPDVIWVPLNRRIFRVATSVAAAALLFFVFSTPLSNYQPQAQSAAVISLKREEAKTIEALTANASLSDEASIVPTEDIVSGEESIQPEAEAVVVESKIEKAIEAPKLNSRDYFVIVGSLPTMEAAQDQLKQVKTEFSSANVIDNGERFRIYVKKFSDKKEAESYLETFRNTHSEYKNAWLHSQKN